MIVADASPLIMLGGSGLLRDLAEIWKPVLVPAEVLSECTRVPDLPGALAVLQAVECGQVHVRTAPTWGKPLPAGLGAGECAAIALAATTGGLLLADDRRARLAAEAHGLSVVGSLAILLELKRRGRVGAVAPVLDDWNQRGFRLSPSVLASVLTRAGEA